MKIRCVATGTADGHAAFVRDEFVESVSPPLIGNEIVRLWGFDRPPIAGTESPSLAGTQFFPPAGGIRAVVWTVPPNGHQTEPQPDARARTEELVPGMAAVEVGADGMHATATSDLELVLEGEVELALDGGESTTLSAGDVAFVNGVRHAWRNNGTATCVLLAVFYGAQAAD